MSTYNYKCDICGHAYKRSEHLSRHYRTHTNSPPRFACETCGKSFNRKDVMLRHQAQLHIAPSLHTPRGRTRLTRDRPHEACEDCALRKVRCDGVLPCSSCAKRNEQCRYSKRRSAFNEEDSTTIDMGSDRELENISTLQQLANISACFSPEPVPVNFYSAVAMDSGTSRSETSQVIEATPVRISDQQDQIALVSGQSCETSLVPNYVDYAFNIMDFLDWNMPSAGPSRLATAPGSPNHCTSPSVGTNRPLSNDLWPQHLTRPYNNFKILPRLQMTDEELSTCNTALVPALSDDLRADFLSQLHAISRQAVVPIDLHDFPDTRTLNATMQIFFDRFHPKLPILQRATFHPTTVSTGLLLMIITIGIYHIDQSVAATLQELAREVIRVAAERDNSLVRGVDFNQTLLLWQHSAIALGNKRFLEICESQRNMLVTHCRRGHFLVEQGLVDRSDQLESDWRSWTGYEERKRLGLAIWYTDALLASHFHMMPYMCIDDLRCSISCEERFWDAPTAVAWQSQLRMQKYPKCPIIHTLVEQSIREEIVYTEDFSRKVLLQVLRKSLNPIGSVTNSYGNLTPTKILSAIDNVKLSTTQHADTDTSQLQYLMLQMEMRAPIASLQARAGRSVSEHESQQVQSRIGLWLTSEDAVSSVYYAATIYHHLSNFPVHSVDEPIAALNSALVLWAYAKYSVTSSSEVLNLTISSHTRPENFNTSFQNGTTKVRLVMEGIGPLGDSNAWRVLTIWCRLMLRMDVCQLSRPYSQILQNLMAAEQAQT